ncbi:MAG: aminotransferase class III-fold pyridoxal phosphate-dependent enzyme [Planctomycetaceae bacterium]|nr:aminotransferase class III-fold pyridoxal phosphate-dependent enzyme [Planctomycetaceae bacterium]
MSSASLLPPTCPTYDPTPASRAFDHRTQNIDSVLETCDCITRLKIPNLLRLYLNPWVTQSCVAISEMIQRRWPGSILSGAFPSYLANSGEEALSGAVKLARYTLSGISAVSSVTKSNHGTNVLLLDDGLWLDGFESTEIQTSGPTLQEPCSAMDEAVKSRTTDTRAAPSRVIFIPGIKRMTSAAFAELSEEIPADKAHPNVSILVLAPTVQRSPQLMDAVRRFRQQPDKLLIDCVTSQCFATTPGSGHSDLAPHIVVLDESWTHHEVPFGAFSAMPVVYRQWTGKGMAMFHSTTFQPNTISTMHFLKCLQQDHPDFYTQIRTRLNSLLIDHRELRNTFRTLFSPSLGKLISAAGFDTEDVTASGHAIRVGIRRVFDGVGGVACSLRGHNPEKWVEEIRQLDDAGDCRDEVTQRLKDLTRLNYHVPAVSGGSAVEAALRLSLAAAYPRKYVVALRGGFGGKTLLALAGTAKPDYKRGLDPLYPHVIYIDPGSSNATEQLRSTLRNNPVAVVQLELIQGVGGVREVPPCILDVLEEERSRSEFLLFIDEIQTGMFRTGPFVRSAMLSSPPDLMTIGKGTSDMMFPFALTLYSERVGQLLKARNCSLPNRLHLEYGFETGYRSILNTLRRSAAKDIAQQVNDSGLRFQETLQDKLREVSIVREVRVFGLLIGIELDVHHTLIHRLGFNAVQLYLLAMMQHSLCPVMMGFCQYEPNILKFTPPLSVTPSEIDQISQTIADSLQKSQLQLLATGLGALRRLRA